MTSPLYELSLQFNAGKDIFYCARYHELWGNQREQVTAILELGIDRGGSLQMWEAYFPNALVFGVDLEEHFKPDPNSRIKTLITNQTNVKAIVELAQSWGVNQFDIIIDDASHIGLPTKLSYEGLFDDYLRAKGHYVIEDWGTGFWRDWPGGKPWNPEDRSREHEDHFPSHPWGIPGFLKQLLDESHHNALRDAAVQRRSKFESMELREGLCILHKF
ncbi:hypothetical protein [Aquidulcibacter sp.]|uniref:hypothetical protein n=1 Tax=Aquidulcibacter sp. TaxID=2052990 RepID=UPI0025C674A4|nr:hypothetical protein [Aquidulcibacter sp.]MCA3695826.1 hypothetical protein [Aquidulcibacter sp.]